MKLPLDPFVLPDLAESQLTPEPSIRSHFQDIPDFRREHGRRHLLGDILVIAACAIFADCDTFVDMAEYGQDNEVWLRSFLELPNGIPSHDTFRRILGRLAPAPFQHACISYARAAAHKLRSNPTPDSVPTDTPAVAPVPPPLAALADSAASPKTPPAAATEPLPSAEPTANPGPFHPSATPAQPTAATTGLTEQQPAALATPPASAAPQPQPPVTPTEGESEFPPLEPLPAPAAEPTSSQAAMAQVVVSSVEPADRRRHLPVDGKTARGSKDPAAGQAALHLVSIWDSEARLTLGQVAVEAKSNEITAIPEVLKLVDLKGAVVSIDAIGTQEEIAGRIRDGGGDYVLAVKGNQPRLHEDVVRSFDRHFEQHDGQPSVKELEVISQGEHGRHEKRRYVLLEDVSSIRDAEKWRDVKRLILVHRECQKSDGTWEEESRYFIGSAACGVEDYAQWIRNHWGIENRLHWVLDVIFHEDESRVRKDHGTENLAMLRRLALGLMGNDKTCKRSMRGKRKRAARDHAYLEYILFNLPDLDTPLRTQKAALPACNSGA